MQHEPWLPSFLPTRQIARAASQAKRCAVERNFVNPLVRSPKAAEMDSVPFLMLATVNPFLWIYPSLRL
jgi:hypothetical protein